MFHIPNVGLTFGDFTISRTYLLRPHQGPRYAMHQCHMVLLNCFDIIYNPRKELTTFILSLQKV
jgi:hypothetical protein